MDCEKLCLPVLLVILCLCVYSNQSNYRDLQPSVLIVSYSRIELNFLCEVGGTVVIRMGLSSTRGPPNALLPLDIGSKLTSVYP